MNGGDILEKLHGRLPALIVAYRLPAQEWSCSVGSGWYIEDEGELFLVVAAHWWSEILKLSQNAETRIELFDGYSDESPTIAFGSARELPVAVVEMDDLQVDFALIPLLGHRRSMVEAHAGYCAFARKDLLEMSRAEIADVDYAYTLGYPDCEVGIDEGVLRLMPMALLLLEEVPPNELRPMVSSQGHVVNAGWLYFRIGDHAQLPDGFAVSGMSGGPVVGSVNGQLNVLGIQTLWWRGLAIVGVQPINNLIKALDVLRELRDPKRGSTK